MASGGGDNKRLRASASTAKRLNDAIAFAEQQQKRLSADGTQFGRNRPYFKRRAIITDSRWDSDANRFRYAWSSAYYDIDSGLYVARTSSDYAFGTLDKQYAINALEINDPGSPGLPIDNQTPIWLEAEETGDGSMVMVFEFGAEASSLIPVDLSEDGTGADGDVSTPVSWVYTATDESGTTYASMSPSHNRMSCKTMKGTKGTIRVHSDGSFELYQTDELPNFGAC